ncbi:SRPBCC domain-containing protein [Nesterenkonia rhizosphaerae]|uniref:Activator of Hsp90 ATPase homologue 1/2-like C-terminal domain-containing protein n=1 Tax=Nesterenkonia rhizosphaerae TaxID=1348272 RepID=A0ABP9FU28_9MICC
MKTPQPPGFADITLNGGTGRIRFERYLNTSLADAWSAVTQPERVARWFAPITVDGQEWITYWDDGREYAKGEIRQCEPQRLLELTWHASDDTKPLAETLLRVTLEEDDAGVLLTLEHKDLQAADFSQYAPGWHAYLDRLAEGDPDLDWSQRYHQLRSQYEPLLPAA